MRRRLLRAFSAVALLAAMSAVLFLGGTAAEAARSALYGCATVFVPSVFPFLVLSGTALKSGVLACGGRLSRAFMKIFRQPAASAEAVIVGLVSGFPVGAAASASLYRSGRITKREAERLMPLCNMPGPAFVIIAAGQGVFGSLSDGIKLYTAVLVGSLISGIIIGFADKADKHNDIMVIPTMRNGLISDFTESVRSAAQTMVMICGFIVFFAVLLSVLSNLLPNDASDFLKQLKIGQVALDDFSPLLAGSFEVTAGLSRLSRYSPLAPAQAAAMLSFSGLCVHAQTVAAVGKGLDFRKYFLGKVLAGGISGIAAAVMFG